MKKSLIPLEFNSAGLMMIGNNVFASEDDHDNDHDGDGDITCHEHAKPDRLNKC